MHGAAADPALQSASFRPCRGISGCKGRPVEVLGAQGLVGMFWGSPRPQWGGGTQPFSSWSSWFPGTTDEVGTQERRRVRACLGMGERDGTQAGQSVGPGVGKTEMQHLWGQRAVHQDEASAWTGCS